MNQEQLSIANKTGWSKAAYEAWTNRHGTPQSYSKKIRENPAGEVTHYLPYIGAVRGKRIINLMGSKGSKAVALSLLGAEVTVVDISESNAKYARELAAAAETHIEYIVSDVLHIQDTIGSFDVVLLELGVLHYFIDLQPLCTIISQLLKQGGIFILRDYHPMYTKLLQVEDNKVIASGDYFQKDVVEVDVAYSILLSEEERDALPKNLIRRWTLGEIVTNIAQAGLHIEELTEECGAKQKWVFPPHAPNGIEDHIPGLYTLIAKNM
ncbi:Methyltransferase domain-containing protein [Bacillus sp. 491mf]|uniref:class I SAM-dependent methyltransferase n=1 Tax=Bacillus TaxID=1386 RepID=UPI00054E5087|nr:MULTISPECIES: class I SAM-dependent methyltransferase [unclassified Bacillus (in: firmicutes)]SFD23671.1 Methyltransferase domain-containing protein [Bacillus sp. 491mf]